MKPKSVLPKLLELLAARGNLFDVEDNLRGRGPGVCAEVHIAQCRLTPNGSLRPNRHRYTRDF